MADERPQPKGRVNLQKAVVLLVETSTQGMEILSQVLSGLGVLAPLKALSIDDAWKHLRVAEIDLIVCGSSVSDGDAYDFIAALRRSSLDPNRFTSAIVLSGHTPMGDIRKARDCGANFVIAKPISPRTLLERIIWIGREPRSFIETGTYTGPDRRFQNMGPPDEIEGRRKEDRILETGENDAAPQIREDIDGPVRREGQA